MTRLSSGQYPMLQALYDNGIDGYMSIPEAQRFDQRYFRSMLIRGWCEYKPGRGFHITPGGVKALEEFHTYDIMRKNPTLPLTAYFDASHYGLTVGRKTPRNLHVMRGAA